MPLMRIVYRGGTLSIGQKEGGGEAWPVPLNPHGYTTDDIERLVCFESSMVSGVTNTHDVLQQMT